jgi:hypothetical protein
MTSSTSNPSSEELRRIRQELWTNLQNIDTRLKQTYVPPHFRITTSSTNSQRTFSTNGQSANDLPSTVKRSRISSSSYDEHQSSLAENTFDDQTSGSSSSKALHSAIVPTNKIIKTKDDLISLVNRDQQSTGRNRRMFGVLLGTLNKFKAEANAYNEQSVGIKRQEIERRLEEKQTKEREDKQHERTELIATKRNCQQKLKLVNIKLEILQRMATHEKAYLPLRNFIRTKTKPYVFFLPKGPMEDMVEKKFQDSQAELDKEMEEFKRECQRELNLLDDTTNINEDEISLKTKKRKLSEQNETADDPNDEDEDNHVDNIDDDDALADLPDEITLSAPEMKSEVGPSDNNSSMESSMHAKSAGLIGTRTVIYDEGNANKDDDQSIIDE